MAKLAAMTMTYVDDSGEDAGLNPLEGAGFDKLYASDIEPELTRLETNRRKAMRTFLIAIGAGVAVAAVESVLGWDFRLVMGTLAVAGVIAIIPLEKVREASKQAVIKALCAPLGITYVEKN